MKIITKVTVLGLFLIIVASCGGTEEPPQSIIINN